MNLTVREAAVLLGRSPRTVRAQVARGVLPGCKVNGRWRLKRETLPLTDKQRRQLQRKAEAVRRAVEEALPEGTSRQRNGRAVRRLADLDAFRLAYELHAQLLARRLNLSLDAHSRARVLMWDALAAISQAVSHYHPEHKLAAIHKARSVMAEALAVVLVDTRLSPDHEAAAWARALEVGALPAVAGFARWVERLRRRG